MICTTDVGLLGAADRAQVWRSRNAVRLLFNSSLYRPTLPPLPLSRYTIKSAATTGVMVEWCFEDYRSTTRDKKHRLLSKINLAAMFNRSITYLS